MFQVSKPTSTGLRHIGAYYEPIPTERKNGSTYMLMRELNHTLGSELQELQGYLSQTTQRIQRLERVGSSRRGSARGGSGGGGQGGHRPSQQRSQTSLGGMRSRERAAGTIKGIKPYGWDPQLRVAQGMPTPSHRGHRGGSHTRRGGDHTKTFPAGPLSKLEGERQRRALEM